MNYASIDIGTNSVLLLIASMNAEGEIRPLVEKAEITRLGEKLDQNGHILPEALERTLKALRQYTDLCHRNQVERIVCVGTDALRRAQNAHEFVQKVQETCGFRVEVIPGKKEAELAYLSAMLDFGDIYPNLVVVDIGGGSTEVIWRREVLEDTARLQTISMRMGSVRLTENFLKTDPVLKGEYRAMMDLIEEKLLKDINPLRLPDTPVTLIGVAGTVTTLSSIAQKLEVYDHEKVQGALLQHTELLAIIEELKQKDLEERKQILGMEPKRADVLLAGAAILEAVMRKFKTDRVVVSDHGIRYGLFYQRFSSTV